MLVNLYACYVLTYSCQQLLIETILSRVLDVNPSSLPGVYWRSLSVWCLRADPKMAVFLGRSVHRLFQKLDALSLAARERFATWFAFHLSNTNFEWPWSAWSEVANVTDPNEPRRYFVQSALHQGICALAPERMTLVLSRASQAFGCAITSASTMR